MSKIIAFLITFFLVSCQTIPYSQLPIIVKSSLYGAEDIDISEAEISERKYSFIKVKFGKKFIAILTLINIDDNVFEWISSSGSKIFTYNGKVIRTSGLTNNINIYSYKNFNCPVFEESIANYDVMLGDPKAFVTQSASINIDPFDESKCLETITTNGFKWLFENKYQYNQNGLPIKASQSIHPMLPVMEIDFYYKY